MTGSTDDGSGEPTTDRVRDNSWSVNLERPIHADDRERVVREAIEAIQLTATGNHVNLVTHRAHGHPAAYLYPELDAEFEGDVDRRYVDQCGCGGHVTRVHVR